MLSEKRDLFFFVDGNKKRLIEISDQIWEFTELGLIEFRSANILADELEKYGLKVVRGVADMPTAFVATWGGSDPIIGILGEYDALPGLSQKKITSKETGFLGSQVIAAGITYTE